MITFFQEENYLFTEAITEKGNKLYFVEVPEDKIKKSTGREIMLDLKESPPIIVYCDFIVSTKMKDALNKADFLVVDYANNKPQQFHIHPLQNFSYNKLKKELALIVCEFDL